MAVAVLRDPRLLVARAVASEGLEGGELTVAGPAPENPHRRRPRRDADGDLSASAASEERRDISSLHLSFLSVPKSLHIFYYYTTAVGKKRSKDLAFIGYPKFLLVKLPFRNKSLRTTADTVDHLQASRKDARRPWRDVSRV